MSWIGFARGRSIVWKTLPGLDPSLSDAAMQVGAAVFAKETVAGSPPNLCHEAAEKAAFSFHYKVAYTSFGNIIMPSVVKKNKTV